MSMAEHVYNLEAAVVAEAVAILLVLLFAILK